MTSPETETCTASSALKKSATVVGDIYTPRIAIEDGAFLEGSVWVHKDTPRPRTKKTIRELLEA